MQDTSNKSSSLPRGQRRVALVAFGGNIATPGHLLSETLLLAKRRLAELGLGEGRISALYRTPCHPQGAGPDYLNAVAAFSVQQGIPANQIIAILHGVEAEFGRNRARRWAARTLDLDLLALDDLVLPDAATQDAWRALPPERQMVEAPDQVILPHPRLQDRGFVLVPMAEVAPDWVHPRLGLTTRQMLAALPPEALEAIRPLGPDESY